MTLSPLTTGLDPTPMLTYMPPRVLLAHIDGCLSVLVDHGVDLPPDLPPAVELLRDAVATQVYGAQRDLPMDDVLEMIRNAVLNGGRA